MQTMWILAAFAVGSIAAAGAVALWMARRRQPREAPSVWPVTVRPLTSFGERRTWGWLTQAMPEQQIAPKLPLARFTHPGGGPDAAHWHKRLNSIYCSFTVASLEGKVLGCVDVDSDKGPSPASQALKRAVLSQLDIPYWVVDPHHLPDAGALRAEFLREPAPDTSAYARLQEENAARHALDAAFVEKRQTRPGAFDSLPTGKNRRAPLKEPTLQAGTLLAVPTESAATPASARAS